MTSWEKFNEEDHYLPFLTICKENQYNGSARRSLGFKSVQYFLAGLPGYPVKGDLVQWGTDTVDFWQAAEQIFVKGTELNGIFYDENDEKLDTEEIFLPKYGFCTRKESISTFLANQYGMIYTYCPH